LLVESRTNPAITPDGSWAARPAAVVIINATIR
jgi:hypothetical protein